MAEDFINLDPRRKLAILAEVLGVSEEELLRTLGANADVAGALSLPGLGGGLQAVSPGFFTRDKGFRSFLDPAAMTRNLTGGVFAPTVPFSGGYVIDPEPAATIASIGALLNNLGEATRVARSRKKNGNGNGSK